MINSEIDHLVRLISKLPGLGLRSARRIVLHLLNNKEKEMLVLSDEIKDVAERVKFCVICGNMDTSEECYICKDEKRDVSTICVVENVGDLWAIERSGVFSGKYHVLGGVLSALDNIGPDDLKIGQLIFGGVIKFQCTNCFILHHIALYCYRTATRRNFRMRFSVPPISGR